MPVELERELGRQADARGLTGDRKAAYVYGTMRKTGWKPQQRIDRKPKAVKPIQPISRLTQLNSRLATVIELASGDYHAKYVPDSVYNQGPGVHIRRAVTIKKKPIPILNRQGEHVTVDLRDASGQVVQRVPKYDNRQTATREYARAKYKYDPTGIKQEHDAKISKMKTDWAAQGRSAEEIKGEARRMGSANFKGYIDEVRGSLRGGQKLQGEIHAHRKYMARELKEVRSIIQAKRKFAGTLPAPLPESELSKSGTGAIQAAGRAGNFKGIKVKDSPKKPLISPEETLFYKGKLNEEVAKVQERAKTTLERVQKKITGRAATGLNRQRSLEGKGPIQRDELKRTSQKLVAPIFDDTTGGPYGGKATTSTIAATLTHGYDSPDNILRMKPTEVTQRTLERIKGRVDTLKNRATGGFEGVTTARKAILNSGSIFKNAAPVAEKAVAEAGYPYLRKIGKAIGGAGLLAGGIYGAKKLYDRRKQNQPQLMSSRVAAIRFGLKLSPKGTSLANQRGAKRLIASGLIKADHIEGMEGVNTQLPSYKKLYEGSFKRIAELTSENRALSEAASKRASRTTYGSAAKARNRGFTEGQESVKEKFLKEQKASRSLHQRELDEATNVRDEALTKATNRGYLAIGTGAAGLATGIAIAPRKRQEVQFAFRREPIDHSESPLSGAVHVGASAGTTAAAGALILGLARKRPGKAFARENLKTTLKDAGKWGGGLAAAGFGGTLIGSAVLGNPRQEDHAAFVKRGALGGAIGGTAVGAGLGILAKRNKTAGKFIAEHASKWRPIEAIRKAGALKAGLIGGAVGGAVGAAHLADEGSQVDTLNALHRERRMSSRLQPIRFAQATFPVARDRYGKEIVNKEVERKGMNYARSAIVGGLLGTQLRKKMGMPIGRAALAGAAAGLGVEAIVRAGTSGSRDRFGEKTKMAKDIESVPWKAGLATSAGITAARLYKKSPLAQRVVRKYFGSRLAAIRFDDEGDRKWAEKVVYGRPRKTYATADRLYTGIGRTNRLIRSTKSAITGQPDLDARGRERKSEFQKPWVKRAVATAALGVGLVGGYRALKGIVQKAPLSSGLGQLRESFLQGQLTKAAREGFPRLAKTTDFIQGTKKDVENLLSKPAAKLTSAMGIKPVGVSEATLKRNKAAATGLKAKAITDAEARKKLKAIGEGSEQKYSSRLQPIHFAMPVEDWRIDDSRGNSARIYAPGHQMRQRRQKEWYERQGVQRSILGGLAIAAPLGIYAAYKKGSFRGFGRGIKAVDRKAARDVNRAAGEYIEAAHGTDFGIVRKKPDTELSARIRPILFGVRKMKSGIIAKWGKDLGQLPDGTQDTIKGTVKLIHPETKASAVYQRSRSPYGKGDNKWYKAKEAYVGNISIPKKFRNSREGIVGMRSVTDEMLGHFDRRGVRASTIAGAYEMKGNMAARQAGTHKLVRVYQRKGFKIDGRGSGPNEWNVPMKRLPNAPAQQPLDAEGYDKHIQKFRDRAYNAAMNKLGEHAKEVAKPLAAIGGAGALAGVTHVAASRTSDDSPNSGKLKAAAITTTAGLGAVAAFKLPQAVSYLQENRKSIRDNIITAADQGRVKIGKAIGRGGGRLRNTLGASVLHGLV